VGASYNCSASITIQLADGEGLLSELQFKTAVRKLQLYQAVDGRREIQLKQTAGSELQGLKVELTDEKAGVVDENTLKVVLRYDGDKRVSLLQDLQSVLLYVLSAWQSSLRVGFNGEQPVLCNASHVESCGSLLYMFSFPQVAGKPPHAFRCCAYCPCMNITAQACRCFFGCWSRPCVHGTGAAEAWQM
jgi:hypothetical protein